jgi:murein DD-endopeptidase MepM/ murein hydrolase activator NlpD
MKNIFKVMVLGVMAVMLAISVGCNDFEISMTTPYADESDIEAVTAAFSTDENCPWGFPHNGLDPLPLENFVPFQAVSSGVVEEIKLWPNDITGDWQVNVIVRYNFIYSVEYAFEPMSQREEDGIIQRENILVEEGQIVSQGDIIGLLYQVGEYGHVHFGLLKFGEAICPDPYFTPEAKDSILRLLRNWYPNADMCY